MGQAITKIASLAAREVKSINLERRAEKIISKDKPIPAPQHPSTVKELQRLNEENVSMEYLHKKNEQLDQFLKDVYVTSPDPAPPLERKINPDRPLPVKGPTNYGITFGYSEKEEAAVPEGKVSLKQALGFISNHQNDPKKYSNAAIASQYKISLADTNEILEHFKMFSVRVQKKEVDPASLTVYERLQLKVKEMTLQNAPEILREVNDLFSAAKIDKEGITPGKEKEEKSLVASQISQEENSSIPTENPTKTKGKSDSETTKMGKAQDKTDLNSKSVEETVTRKRNQENG